MKPNITLLTDSYKLNHWNQYPKNCENVYSYFESRNGSKYPKTVFVGLQAIIKKYLEGEVVTMEDADEGELLSIAHFGHAGFFNREGWEYIVKNHEGRLPVRIKAVKEGSAVDINNVLMSVEVTDPKCFWLTNFLETILTHVWYPSNVATISYHLKGVLLKYLRETTDSEEIVQACIPFMLHDFGFRGATSIDAAAIGGFAHLTQFMGTDTVPAMLAARHYYGANKDFSGIGYSVAANEHSVMTAQGEAGEPRVLDQMLEEYDEGIFSCVSDSYNIERFVDVYIRERKEKILARKPNALGIAKFVIRPDSLRGPNDTPERQMVWLSMRLWDIFGGHTNKKGLKVINPKVGLLWGDGIGPEGIEKILDYVSSWGFSVEHLVFGMGGGLLQKHNRDTQRNAFKCSAQLQGGEWIDIQKNPLDETKKSKAGKLMLTRDKDGTYKTTRTPGEIVTTQGDLLELVFLNGQLMREQTLDDIREVSSNA